MESENIMVRTEIGFDAVLTKIGSKFKPEIDDVVIEFVIRFVDKHDVQSFLDSYQKKCSLENVANLFNEPVQWKSIAIDANYRFNLDFDELNDMTCILKTIKVRRKYSAKDLSDVSSSLNDGNLETTLSNFKNSSDNLSKILIDINQGDGTLSKLIKNDSLFNNLNDASKSIDLLLEDIRLNPNRYIHFSVFGKKNKPYKSK